MSLIISSLSLLLCSFIYVTVLQAKIYEPSSSIKTDSGITNMQEATSQCNESFHIKQEFLQELNDTGSFPDESDKTAMCFIKCYLETIGVWTKDYKVNKEKMILMYQLDSDDIIDDCSNETSSANVTEECDKAYFFIRCIMSRTLLERLGEDNDNEK